MADEVVVIQAAKAYAKSLRKPPGNRWVALGDSITKGADIPEPTTTLWRSASWPALASWSTSQRAWLIHNAGVSGDRSDQMIARFATDVAAYRPTVLTILAGANDITQGVALATWQANIKTLIQMTRAIGATPILCTITPRSSSSFWTAINLWNQWLKRYAAAEGISVIDLNAVLTDVATGNFLSAYSSGDGLHPSPAGYGAMGTAAAAVLNTVLPAWAPPLPVQPNDGLNLLATPFFNADADANGRADNWNTTGTTTGTVYSLVSGDTSIKGNWQQIDSTAGSANVGITQSKSSGFGAVGDVLAFSGRFDTTADPTIVLQFTGTSSYARAVHNPRGGSGGSAAGATSGIFYIEKAIPTGTTGVSATITCAAVGVLKVAQVSLVNLTAAGLASV